MAGNGGFKNAINGFDKNEVNEYIGNLRKKLQEMEADIRNNEEKTRAAVKTAEEADAKISEIENRSAQKVAELEAQVKTERRNADNLQNEIDELKRKLRHAGTAAAPNAASTAEAEKRAAEIVDKANATARDIVEKAKQTAHQIISGAGGAQQQGGVSPQALESFNAILRDLTRSVNDALNTANKKASEITGAPAAEVSALPLDLSGFSAPRAEVPAPKPAAKSEPKAPAADDIFADLSDDSEDMSDFGDVKPLDPPKPNHEIVDGFDLSDVGGFIAEEPVAEVVPLDTKKTGGAVLDDDFAADLLTQTVPSSVLKDQVDEDLFAAVQEREEQFAVQPSDEKDFDMGDASSGLDAMNALLGQMGAALESAGGSASMDLGDPEPAASSPASDNPWADLQNQLNAMEESGNFGGGSEPAKQPEKTELSIEDPKVPDADDSSIWNFDDDMSAGSSDDDMSADLFGSF